MKYPDEEQIVDDVGNLIFGLPLTFWHAENEVKPLIQRLIDTEYKWDYGTYDIVMKDTEILLRVPYYCDYVVIPLLI